VDAMSSPKTAAPCPSGGRRRRATAWAATSTRSRPCWWRSTRPPPSAV